MNNNISVVYGIISIDNQLNATISTNENIKGCCNSEITLEGAVYSEKNLDGHVASNIDLTGSVRPEINMICEVTKSKDPTSQPKTATPTFDQNIVLPDSEYNFLSQVTVNPIPVTEEENEFDGITIII